MSHMLNEAQEAPQRVRDLLKEDQVLYSELGHKLRNLNPSLIATVARGSSDHTATYASYLFPICTGRVVASVPPSLTTVLDAPINLSRQFLLAISQSGTSPDILRTLERARKSGALTTALVNHADSPVGKAAEVLLDQRAGLEKGLAATKTVLCTSTAIARIAAEWSQDELLLKSIQTLPDQLNRAVEIGLKLSTEQLKGISNVYVISRSLGMGAAYEIALKIKETCGLHAEAYSSAEVRHGPREIVDKNFAVIALAIPGSGYEDVLSIAQELRNQGARVLIVSPSGAGAATQPTFALPETKDYRLMPLVALQLLYPWLAQCSVALGRNPDQPKTLKSKVINTI